MCPNKKGPILADAVKASLASPHSVHRKHAVHSGELSTSKEIRLPKSLRGLVAGYRAGHGINSSRSLSTVDGIRPDLVPIVVSLSAESGFKTFLTALATLSALREEGSGDVILTHCFSLDCAELIQLLQTYRGSGRSAEITFEISMQAPGQDGTFQST